MRGQRVVCKDVTGHPIVRVVWDRVGGIVLIHSEEQFSKRMSGEPYLEPVGFPAEDVFSYEEGVLDEFEKNGIEPWPKLAVYNGGL